ncbi:MAG: 2-keto-4-pentenoate hydratase/2-oxohepta-3-ene-1,7-dioic acid hydratase (catechol pathway) [Roseibaca calidilacus]|uniref:2-keto-4-pentenoate hydratase/2-oxohepta-3-ene-1,7-dioic acid hydratase (Catechol pathway) n=1 Tax=Roseibaca calidilacus TaxID=1666912 RepID=A0A0P7WJ82_9RHOB|nr:fumarylacetoacetate hydrolase family protein [Roseibaca calidilacus]KPP94226.1 MAG: 2-keto-4-pentenoate hydratase/2-oxohepta-3-ene-1,7-dioic acid hydratase (catechol pathway) [Roseibaca calidilacus]CUX81343.1 ureidoglycolate lyase [Roseibaca calidilacus]
MKLVRFGPAGQEKPGMLDKHGRLRDLSGLVADFAGNTVSLAALAELAARDLESAPVVAGLERLGPPLAWVPNFYCIGLNYAAHAAETGAAKPAEPLVFSKATSSLAGPEDDIIIPKAASRVDWEVELGVVIGKPALNISESEALDHVAGYVAINDVSERSFQKDRGGQWIKGKSAPSFGKIGPLLVTRDEVPDPQALDLSLAVNGSARQESNTSDMIFSVAEIVAYMSQFMRLMPGDVIATGTPSGVGLGMTPPQFLAPGDVVALEVAGLGRQFSQVVAA